MLQRQTRVYVCKRGHSFDLARSGYLNLLQPQDRRSRTAGDSAEVVEARARLLQAGVGTPALDELVERAAAVVSGSRPVAVDLGAGTGDLLGAFERARETSAAGIDLSSAAAAHAARRFPGILWVVANADRRLPLLDASVDIVFSVHARRTPAECARVVRRGGVLIIAVPGARDLIELREAVQGRALVRDRIGGAAVEHERWFDAIDRFSIDRTVALRHDALSDLLRVTYRGARAGEKRRLANLTALDVTTASDVIVLRRS